MSRTFLVTGASKGIGLALAQRLHRSGQHVVGLARRSTADFPGTLVLSDLADPEATEATLGELTAHFRFDGVVNNVGLVRPQPLGAVELPVLDEVLRVNLHPALQTVQALLPGMIERGWGRVVNITSLTVLGAPERTAYAAAKAALASFSRSWALELATTGITVNAVSPGPTQTALFRENNPVGSSGEQRYLAQVPMRRLGWPDEIASAIAFLLSDDAASSPARRCMSTAAPRSARRRSKTAWCRLHSGGGALAKQLQAPVRECAHLGRAMLAGGVQRVEREGLARPVRKEFDQRTALQEIAAAQFQNLRDPGALAAGADHRVDVRYHQPRRLAHGQHHVPPAKFPGEGTAGAGILIVDAGVVDQFARVGRKAVRGEIAGRGHGQGARLQQLARGGSGRGRLAEAERHVEPVGDQIAHLVAHQQFQPQFRMRREERGQRRREH